MIVIKAYQSSPSDFWKISGVAGGAQVHVAVMSCLGNLIAVSENIIHYGLTIGDIT